MNREEDEAFTLCSLLPQTFRKLCNFSSSQVHTSEIRSITQISYLSHWDSNCYKNYSCELVAFPEGLSMVGES